jgi:hypothetical protein
MPTPFVVTQRDLDIQKEIDYFANVIRRLERENRELRAYITRLRQTSPVSPVTVMPAEQLEPDTAP